MFVCRQILTKSVLSVTCIVCFSACFRRSPSDTSMFSLGGRDGLALDEFDIMLDDISAGIESMSTSVDMNTNPESYMPS